MENQHLVSVEERDTDTQANQTTSSKLQKDEQRKKCTFRKTRHSWIHEFGFQGDVRIDDDADAELKIGTRNLF